MKEDKENVYFPFGKEWSDDPRDDEGRIKYAKRVVEIMNEMSWIQLHFLDRIMAAWYDEKELQLVYGRTLHPFPHMFTFSETYKYDKEEDKREEEHARRKQIKDTFWTIMPKEFGKQYADKVQELWNEFEAVLDEDEDDD